ncbi:MAG: 23S rRNA (pseudouridine(1915)-N(3))-methyltransferase RlmH [Saprospiraceae bacterium]|nr:23S rRNA (pseudouridine(1915)-N(3))-methyltransferase RlmH [Saprospiraceae bacterium]
MKVELWQIGKTAFPYLREGMDVYEKRIRRYLPFEVVTLPDIRHAAKLSVEELQRQEGERILGKIQPQDYLILLDERGKTGNSREFAEFLQKGLLGSHRRIVFQIGGAYGFSEEVYRRADRKIALSAMTFSHQLVRLIFLEQLYRAFSILHNEPYHHD